MVGDTENYDKFSRRTVKVTREHNEEVKRLLKVMGIPYVDAPGEAEAQCAALAKAGHVYAAGSEDMDTLTFGSPVLLRHLTFSEAKKAPISEIHLDKALVGLGMDMDEFIDFCILLGCDYCDSIKGIGPHRALSLIREHKSIEKILLNIDKTKHPVAENWPFAEARRLFKEPLIKPEQELDLKWAVPDEEGIVQFLVTEKQFNEERVRKSVQKMVKSKSQSTQGRLDSFFKVIPSDSSKSATKRKAPESNGKKKAKTTMKPRR